jgi:hypothetical protein
MSDHGPRKHAEDCVSRAHNAPSTFEKTLHLLMADAWMKFAHAGERHSGQGAATKQRANARSGRKPKRLLAVDRRAEETVYRP